MSSKNPVISLIIPIYNVGKFLDKTLESVKNQTFEDFEVICVNDGSTDNSAEIIKEYTESDKRFVVINQENQDVSVARNNGLKVARGQYVMFLDGDDYINPYCLEIALKGIIDTQADICQFKIIKVKENEVIDSFSKENLSKKETVRNPLELCLKYRLKKSTLVYDKIYKAEIAKSIQFKNIRPGEDDLYVFEAISASQKMSFINNVLYYYVRHPQSIMSIMNRDENKIKYYKTRVKLTDKFYDVIKELYFKNSDNKKLQKMLMKYYNKHYFFKEYLLKPVRKKIDKHILLDNLEVVKQREQRKDINFNYISWRYVIILKLLEKGFYKLARIFIA